MSSEIGQNQAFSQQSSIFSETFTAFFYLKLELSEAIY
jgi:hypothetical protein